MRKAKLIQRKIRDNGLPQCLGKPVRYRGPKRVGGLKKGVVEDIIWANKKLGRLAPHRKGSHPWGDYAFFAQFIKWDDEAVTLGHPNYSVRLGYYRRSPGEKRWRYGSQTTFDCYDRTALRSLLKETLAKKNWLSKLKA